MDPQHLAEMIEDHWRAANIVLSIDDPARREGLVRQAKAHIDRLIELCDHQRETEA